MRTFEKFCNIYEKQVDEILLKILVNYKRTIVFKCL